MSLSLRTFGNEYSHKFCSYIFIANRGSSWFTLCGGTDTKIEWHRSMHQKWYLEYVWIFFLFWSSKFNIISLHFRSDHLNLRQIKRTQFRQTWQGQLVTLGFMHFGAIKCPKIEKLKKIQYKQYFMKIRAMWVDILMWKEFLYFEEKLVKFCSDTNSTKLKFWPINVYNHIKHDEMKANSR